MFKQYFHSSLQVHQVPALSVVLGHIPVQKVQVYGLFGNYLIMIMLSFVGTQDQLFAMASSARLGRLALLVCDLAVSYLSSILIL